MGYAMDSPGSPRGPFKDRIRLGMEAIAIDTARKVVRLADKTIEGLIAVGQMRKDQRGDIVSTWIHDIDYAYPVPTLGRDEALARIQPVLMARGVYSRGRFGAWEYEVGNMDHSLMQGVEAVEAMLEGREEKTVGRVW